jgi:RNA polymerase sigma factor (TIGR02999 family)
MRRILIESARRKARAKHGGGLERVELSRADIAVSMEPEELLALDAALEELQNLDSRGAELINLRFFAGLTQEQAAHSLGISVATAERSWAFWRTWLFKKVREPKSIKV